MLLSFYAMQQGPASRTLGMIDRLNLPIGLAARSHLVHKEYLHSSLKVQQLLTVLALTCRHASP
jgi:hypothetical protein